MCSHSSTESEIAALEVAMRTEGLPLMSLWGSVMAALGTTPISELRQKPRMVARGHPDPNNDRLLLNTNVVIAEDNNAVIRILDNGRATSLKYVKRTQRVSVE